MITFREVKEYIKYLTGDYSLNESDIKLQIVKNSGFEIRDKFYKVVMSDIEILRNVHGDPYAYDGSGTKELFDSIRRALSIRVLSTIERPIEMVDF